VNQCLQKRESDTISQEDVEPTEEQKEICQKLKEYLQNANVRVRLPKLKAIPKKNIQEQIRIVEAVMVSMKMAYISETNALVYAGARLVTERLGHTCKMSHRGKRGLENRSKSSEQTSANCRNGREKERERPA